MPDYAADRNLLFGILALQMDFIRRDALIAAMNAWVLDKKTPLGQILLAQKALTPETHALLDALVKKHLEMHGNDLEKSLAAVSSLADKVRHELEEIEDADVQASLQHVAKERSTGETPGTIAYSAGASTSKGLRFRILRPHAKGGLGTVFVAHDEELNREVALKEIQDRHADHSESRARFLLEAEITGGLEHPGIVPVYGLGQYEDGRPFYAMRFIRGDSLKDAIQHFHKTGGNISERPVEFRELLERLIDVCNAIQYAHDRGVLHRDLKPGNIMLGKYGETLVVDWGLAKPLGRAEAAAASRTDEPVLRPSSASGSAETMQGSAIGTPQYMSPEQAAGRHDQLGPASDIYSLGATLFCLLTGKAPVEDSAVDHQRKADLGKLLHKVKTGAIARPRQRNPAIAPALEAICLKAMALQPQDRYASPSAMVDDLKHWLADEPISAYREPWTVKARRWVGKRRTLVTGVAAAVLVGLLCLSTATVLLAQANDLVQKKNQELTEANDLVQKKNQELTKANAVIQKQNDDIKQEVAEKEKQRKLAESRLRQSLDAVGLFANDARKYCEDAMVPGESRRRLYEVLITQLERQVDQEVGEASIDSLRNRLWMYQTLCAVTKDFDEYAKSKGWFDKGMKTVAQWERMRAGDARALSFRATLLHLRGLALESQQSLVEAKTYFTEALALRRQLVGNPEVDQFTRGKSLALLADSLDSVEQFVEALKLRAQVTKMHEKDMEAHFAAREAWCWTLQKAAYAAKDYATRKAYLSKADKMSAKLIEERPHSRNILLRWALAAKTFGELEYNFGKRTEKEGKPDEAKKYFAQVGIHFKRLNEVSKKLATSEELVEGLQNYARSFYTLALVEELNGRPQEARKHYQTSRDIRARTFHDYRDFRNAAHLQIDLLFSQVALGELSLAMNTTDEMAWTYRQEPTVQYRLACIYALAVAEVSKKDPLTPLDKRMQARCRQEAVRCLQYAFDGGFSDFFHTSIDSDLDAIRDDPLMKEFEASHSYRRGVLEKKRGDANMARAHFEKAQALAQELLKALPMDRRSKHVQIAWLCVQVQLGHAVEAVKGADELQPKLIKRSAAMFQLARVYALASAAAENAKLQEELRTKALTALNQAAQVGLRQVLLSEEDLVPIRSDPRFQQTLRLYTK